MIMARFLALLVLFYQHQVLAFSPPSARRLFVPQRHRQHGASSSSFRLSASFPDRSCVELIDPATGCQIVLIGCFHGSPSSAADVEREILATSSKSTDDSGKIIDTDVIALELCASRFSDLRKSWSLRQEQQQQQQPQQAAVAPGQTQASVVMQFSTTTGWADVLSFPDRSLRFVQVIIDTILKRGLSTGIATAILGSVSGMQTALSGFTPGLEFTTALELAQRHDCDLILADQVVEQTLERVGQIPKVVQSMAQEVLTQRKQQGPSQSQTNESSNDATQWEQSRDALSTALVGDPTWKPDYQVNIGQVLTRNPAVMQELARLMIPPVIIAQLTLMVLNQVIDVINDHTMEQVPTLTAPAITNAVASNPSSVSHALSQYALEGIPHVLSLVALLTAAYALLAVPVTQVILRERDDQLTRGIQAACQQAVIKREQRRMRVSGNEEDGDDSQPPGKVVAVLGLLHVNGVAQRILASSPFSLEVEEPFPRQ